MVLHEDESCDLRKDPVSTFEEALNPLVLATGPPGETLPPTCFLIVVMIMALLVTARQTSSIPRDELGMLAVVERFFCRFYDLFKGSKNLAMSKLMETSTGTAPTLSMAATEAFARIKVVSTTTATLNYEMFDEDTSEARAFRNLVATFKRPGHHSSLLRGHGAIVDQPSVVSVAAISAASPMSDARARSQTNNHFDDHSSNNNNNRNNNNKNSNRSGKSENRQNNKASQEQSRPNHQGQQKSQSRAQSQNNQGSRSGSKNQKKRRAWGMQAKNNSTGSPSIQRDSQIRARSENEGQNKKPHNDANAKKNEE
jgi:hypothetical protein